MKNIIICLKKGFNGLLQAPTGSGKTLCILAASLAWLQ
jgi:regulator of telomere elongation helicase 1